MATQFEKEARLKALVKKASIYPAVVAVVAVVVVIAMLTFVVPTFQQMFEELDATLPGITLFIIALSKFMQALLVSCHSRHRRAGPVFPLLFRKTNSGMRVFGKLGSSSRFSGS
jgi:type IV pilus assembly protein PilC